MKTCTKCNIQKDYSAFNKMKSSKDGHRPQCKSCRSVETKSYREKNKDKIKANNLKFYNINKEQRKDYHAKWRELNKEYVREYSRKLSKINAEEKRAKRNRYIKNKRNSDPVYRLRQVVRCRLRMFFTLSSFRKNCKTIDLIGCDFETLKNHLESQFKDGMSWDNMGQWHIDHIKPLYLAKDEKSIYELCNYKNLQPLWAKDNLIKGKVY